jgi:hypothetical protein
MWLFWGVVIILSPIRIETSNKNISVTHINTRETDNDNVTQTSTHPTYMQGRKAMAKYA